MNNSGSCTYKVKYEKTCLTFLSSRRSTFHNTVIIIKQSKCLYFHNNKLFTIIPRQIINISATEVANYTILFLNVRYIIKTKSRKKRKQSHFAFHGKIKKYGGGEKRLPPYGIGLSLFIPYLH